MFSVLLGIALMGTVTAPVVTEVESAKSALPGCSSPVEFRRAAKVATDLHGETEPLRDPEWRWWNVERDSWMDGSQIASVVVDAHSILHLTLAEEAVSAVGSEPPGTLAVFFEGESLGVARVDLDEKARVLSLSGLRPPHVARIAVAFGAKGAMALGPYVALTLRSSQTRPGARFVADAYVGGVPDVAQYKLVIQVRNGLGGYMMLEGASIDSKRPDFVFEGAESVQVSSSASTATLESRAISPKVDPAKSRYLGTYVFRVSENAKGAFTLKVDDRRSELRDENGELIPFRPGAEVILVSTHADPRTRR